jgi:hypothetical protein
MWYFIVALLFRRAARPWPLVSLGRSRQDILDIHKRAEFPHVLLAATALEVTHTAEPEPARTQADRLTDTRYPVSK